MRYTLFNQDGSHAANIECHPDDAPYQAIDGQAIVKGGYGDGFYFDGQRVCEKPVQPTPAYEWLNFEWVLSEAKSTELRVLEDAHFINQARLIKAQALASIVVTTSTGKVFDGDETARNNMQQALTAAQLTGETSAVWKLADNTLAEVDVGEVEEALVLSIKRVGQIVMGQI